MNIEYSDPYNRADQKSACYQKWYFKLLIIEYFLLFLTAINTIYGEWYKHHIAISLLFTLACIFSFKHLMPMTSQWYKNRALAESIKTLSWRFMMRTEPFNTKPLNDVKLLKINIEEVIKDIGLKVNIESITTDSMKVIYKKSLIEKVEIYEKYRIEDQYQWYTKKAIFNRRMAKIFWIIIIVLYAISFLVSYINMNINENVFYVSILTTLISSILGWSQIKRYDELSSSYLLAAKEILSMKESIHYISTNDDLSDFVIEAEQAFSREHTQWAARRLIKVRTKLP